MRAVPRRDRPASPDAGTTLVELITVMFVLSIVVATLATLAIGFTRTNAENVSRQTSLDDARGAVERMSETLRTAVKPSQLISVCSETCSEVDAFMAGTDFSVQFYANIDNPGNTVGPSRITYTLPTSGSDAGVLTETVLTPEDVVPATPVVDPGTDGYVYCNPLATGATEECKSHYQTRRLSIGVLGAKPVFAYYDRYGARLTVTGTGLTSSQLDDVLAIELTVSVQSTTVTKANPTTYIQRITLPNAQAVLRQGEDEDA